MRKVVSSNFFSSRLLRLRDHPGRSLSCNTSLSINLICIIDSHTRLLRVLQEVRVGDIFPFISFKKTLT